MGQDSSFNRRAPLGVPRIDCSGTCSGMLLAPCLRRRNLRPFARGELHLQKNCPAARSRSLAVGAETKKEGVGLPSGTACDQQSDPNPSSSIDISLCSQI